MCWPLLGHFNSKYYEKMWPQSYSASLWTNIFSISLWEGPKTKHVHDLGIVGRVHDSQNQLILSLETPNISKSFKKIPNAFRNNIRFENLKIAELQKIVNVGKDGHRQISTIRLISSWKS